MVYSMFIDNSPGWTVTFYWAYLTSLTKLLQYRKTYRGLVVLGLGLQPPLGQPVLHGEHLRIAHKPGVTHAGAVRCRGSRCKRGGSKKATRLPHPPYPPEYQKHTIETYWFYRPFRVPLSGTFQKGCLKAPQSPDAQTSKPRFGSSVVPAASPHWFTQKFTHKTHRGPDHIPQLTGDQKHV
jgi:hypothetical protein